MRKLFVKKIPLLLSIALSLGIVAATFIYRSRADAQVTPTPIPFGGQIATEVLCCNGIMFTLTPQYQSPARGTFIMEWPKMIPDPTLGIGLYQWWALAPSEVTLGDALPGGKCQTIDSECDTTIPVTYNVMQTGTTLTK